MKREQPKIDKKQELEMARQALGRVKEMELTPEQKEKVMAMIEEATAAENGGNQSKALNFYLELKKYLQKINEVPTDRIEANPEKIKKQLEIIDAEMNEIESMPRARWSINKLVLWEALEEQKNIIMTPSQGKTKVIAEEDIHLDTAIFFSEKEIAAVISKNEDSIEETTSLKESTAETLFLQERTEDKDGKLLTLKLGLAGIPDVEYFFSLAGLKTNVAIDRGDTNIIRIVYSNNRGQKSGQVIAKYDENSNSWEFPLQ